MAEVGKADSKGLSLFILYASVIFEFSIMGSYAS